MTNYEKEFEAETETKYHHPRKRKAESQADPRTSSDEDMASLLPNFEPDPIEDSTEEKAIARQLHSLNQWSEKFYTPREQHSPGKTVYPLAQLANLASIVAHKEEDEDRDRARFVLLKSRCLVFAEENKPSRQETFNPIPKHVEMTTQKGEAVLAAGTIYFDKTGKIKAIDHKSGGFLPDFSSLNPVLSILKENNLLADTIELIELHKESGGVRSRTNIRSDLLSQPLELATNSEKSCAPQDQPTHEKSELCFSELISSRMFTVTTTNNKENIRPKITSPTPPRPYKPSRGSVHSSPN